jgi:hypothetical protein
MNDNVVSLLVSLLFFFLKNQKKREKRRELSEKIFGEKEAKNQGLRKGAFVCVK